MNVEAVEAVITVQEPGAARGVIRLTLSNAAEALVAIFCRDSRAAGPGLVEPALWTSGPNRPTGPAGLVYARGAQWGCGGS